MRKRERGKAGTQSFILVREQKALQRRNRVLASPLGGLQVIAAHLNQLPGQRAQCQEPDCPEHIKEEVHTWEFAERVVTQSLAQGVELFNAEARHTPMFLQVEHVQGEASTFLASCEMRDDRRGDVLRHLWWYYFHAKVGVRLKRCPVCQNFFVDTSKNRVTVRCSTACTDEWWTRARRKDAGHKLNSAARTHKGGKSHGAKKR